MPLRFRYISFQVAFVDDPCHGYLDAFARFEGRDIVSAITIVLVYTAVFHFTGSGCSVPGATTARSGFFARCIHFVRTAIVVAHHQGTKVEWRSGFLILNVLVWMRVAYTSFCCSVFVFTTSSSESTPSPSRMVRLCF